MERFKFMGFIGLQRNFYPKTVQVLKYIHPSGNLEFETEVVFASKNNTRFSSFKSKPSHFA